MKMCRINGDDQEDERVRRRGQLRGERIEVMRDAF